MTDATITCPNCSHEIALTESLAGPLVAEERRKSAEALAAQRESLTREAMEAAKAELAEESARQAAQSKAAIAEREAEVRRLKAEAADQGARLKEAQEAKLAALRKERELEERAAALDLAVEEQLAVRLREETEKRKRQGEEALARKLAEKDAETAQRLEEAQQQMEAMRRQIDTLKKKSEQGSMQAQGEAAEVILEDRLAGAFPQDRIEPVGKGVRGADCLQVVEGAGAILWESKRTQNWSKDWLPKLRDDMRGSNADMAVLTSIARPEGVESFALVDGVWVCAPAYAVALAGVLRQGLIEVASARLKRDGQETKTELLYDYLTGPQFRSRVEAVVERFEQMQDELRKEKKFMAQRWAAREKMMEKATDAMVGMYGDIQGIAGSAVADLPMADVGLLEEGEDD